MNLQAAKAPTTNTRPGTATSRGIETSLRRLAMLEPVYRLAPDLVRSGRVNGPHPTQPLPGKPG